MSNLVGSVLPLRMYLMVDFMDMGPFRDLVAICDKAPYRAIDRKVLEEMSQTIQTFESQKEMAETKIQVLKATTLPKVDRAMQKRDVLATRQEICAASLDRVIDFLDFMKNPQSVQKEKLPSDECTGSLGYCMLELQRRGLNELIEATRDSPSALTETDKNEMLRLGVRFCRMYESYFRLVFCAEKIGFLTRETSPEKKARAETHLCKGVAELLGQETRKMLVEERGEALRDVPLTELPLAELPLPLTLTTAVVLQESMLIERVVPLYVTAILSRTQKIVGDFLFNSLKKLSEEEIRANIGLVHHIFIRWQENQETPTR